MGNSSKKLAAQCTLLSKDEQKILANAFKAASKNSDKIRDVELTRLWSSTIDPRLSQLFSNFLFGFGNEKKNIVEFQRFAELYVYCVRGTIDEKKQALYNCLSLNENVDIPHQLLKEYCESIASSFMRVIRSAASGATSGQIREVASQWLDKGFFIRAQNVQALGEALLSSVVDDGDVGKAIKQSSIEKWIATNTVLLTLTSMIIRWLYEGDRTSQEEGEGAHSCTQHHTLLLPLPDGIKAMPNYPAFVDLSQVVWINAHLPTEHQEKWRFLFSSDIHGESFSTMLGRISEQGPSVIIIEDTKGHIFGGYAANSWSLSPNFSGSDESFLFSLAPKMRIYPASGYNDHYQYLNTGQKTMPNGLLMGGQLEYGAIWLPAEFGKGCSSESCSTYRGYKRLSHDKCFNIRSLEVWGVGEKPLSMKESGERDVSILDSNLDAKALLKMAGREEHSEGIREAPPL